LRGSLGPQTTIVNKSGLRLSEELIFVDHGGHRHFAVAIIDANYFSLAADPYA
jgi:hypothetical protein